MKTVNPYSFLKAVIQKMRKARVALIHEIRKAKVTRSVICNQREILELSRIKNSIFLEPIPPEGGRGNIEHYYHFVFDLILPIYFLTNEISATTFVLKNFGIYSSRIKQVFPNCVRVELDTAVSEKTPRISLIGMNPNCVDLTNYDLKKFSTYMYELLGIDRSQTPNKILLIERLPPESYFITDAIAKGGGTQRRSIPNHEDLALALKLMTKDPFEFHNIQLEKIPLEKQVEYFYNARVVVAQHGAGLANCIWMRPGSIVIELNHNFAMHFQATSRAMGHSYYRYKTAGPHATIDVGHFKEWVFRELNLKEVFD